MQNDTEWETFTDTLAQAMTELLRKNVNIKYVVDMIENNKIIIGASLLEEDLTNTVYEVDGFRNYYLSVIDMLKTRPSRDKLSEFMLK